MELKRIQWENSPDGAWINVKDFDPSRHKPWVEPTPEKIEAVEIAGIQEAIAPISKRTTKKKVNPDVVGTV